MDYLNKIEKAVIFIENNLKSKFLLVNVAQEVCLSKYHFHKLFHAIMGETIYEYTRGRRISSASNELLYTNRSIADIAFDYQFESQEAFTRSFKDIYKITPAKYRKERLNKIVFEKREFNKVNLLHLINGIGKEPKIVEKEEIKLIGLSANTSISENSIPQLWANFLRRKTEIKSDITPEILIGLGNKANNFSIDSFTDNTEYTYMVGKKVLDFTDIPDGMELKTVPANKYALFSHKGSFDKFRLTYVYIYGSWFPKSAYKISDAPDIEWYDSRFLGSHNNNSEIDIYIPII